MQKGRMDGIEAAFHRLQVIAFLQALAHVALLVAHIDPFVCRRCRLVLRWAEVRPEHAAALDKRIALQLHALAKTRVIRLRGDLYALPGDVVLPAVVGAAQPPFLIAAEPERRAAMRTELIDQSQPVLGIAQRDEALAEQLYAHRRAIGLGQLGGRLIALRDTENRLGLIDEFSW